MAEPARFGKELFGIDREFGGSRLENEILSKVFSLILGVTLTTRKVDGRTCGRTPCRDRVDTWTMKGARS
jgi:hypothetical protein